MSQVLQQFNIYPFPRIHNTHTNNLKILLRCHLIMQSQTAIYGKFIDFNNIYLKSHTKDFFLLVDTVKTTRHAYFYSISN